MLKIIGSQWASLLLRIITALILTPFLIAKVGAAGYGVWVFLNAVIGYLTMVQAGMPASSLRHLSDSMERGDYTAFNRMFGNVLVLFTTVAGILMGSAVALAVVVEPAALNIAPEQSSDARAAFLLATLAASVTLLANPVMNVLEAHNAYVIRNLVDMLATVTRTVLTVVLVAWEPTLTQIALGTLAGELVLLVGVVACVARRLPAVRFRFRGGDRATLKSIFSFSSIVFLTVLGARLSYKTDALVIGLALPMAAVSVYSVGNTLALYLSRLINAVAEPLMPRATRLRKDGKAEQLRDLYLKWSRFCLSVSLLVGLYLVVLGPAFVGWWINPEFGHQVRDVLRILVVSFIVMLPASTVGFRLLLGLTQPHALAAIHLGAGLLNLAISIALVRELGLVGVALGTAVPNLLIGGLVLLLCCRELDVGPGHYLRYVALRPLAATLPLLGLLVWVERTFPIETWYGLMAAGVLHLAAFAALWIGFVQRNDPHVDLARILAARLGRSR